MAGTIEAVPTWSVVVPVKRLALAKSRLGGIYPGLALAFAQDTVAAALASAAVARVIVVTDDDDVRAAVGGPSGLGVVVRPDVRRGGLNEAVRSGASYAVALAGPHPVAALPSDLPALLPDRLEAALAAASGHDRAFVPDAVGTGTTLLSATLGVLHPHYGPDSAGAHARGGAARLDGHWPGLRHDVDTIEDLLAAQALGLGSATTAVVRSADIGRTA